MTATLELSLAIERYDRTQPLLDGRVAPDGVEFTPFVYRSPERHRRMLKHGEFDVCELSGGSYLASLERDYPFTAIPVFPHRRFRHGFYFVNAEAGIEEPGDLEGARVGLRRWQNTAGLWMRGAMREHYGVDLSTVEWYIDDEDEVDVAIPERYSTRRVPDDDDINAMLVRGDLDAAMYPRKLSAFDAGDPTVERLFPDFRAEEEAYHEATGVFPVMHVVVIRDAVVEEYPWVPMNVRKAFHESKVVGMNEPYYATQISLAWAEDELERQEAVLGPDPYADGLAENRTDLEHLVAHGRADGLLSGSVEPEDLFVESSLEDLPSYV